MSVPPALRLNRDRLQLPFDLLRQAASTGELPTGLLAVATNEETVRCEAYGPDGSIPSDRIYLIASVTKPIVATAIMQLVERGRLLLEDPVSTYIPEFAANGKEAVTFWHLLTHTSGMADDYMTQVDGPATAEKDLRGALDTHLRFEPGTRYQYSNPAFRILGEAISRVSGQGYRDYLRDEVFQPAGMVETTFKPKAEWNERVMPVPDFPPVPGGFGAFVDSALPSGGLFSTAADLIAFGQSFLNAGRGRNGHVLSPITIGIMTAQHTNGIISHETGEPAFWGLSWEKAVPKEARLLSASGFGHGGMTGTYLWIEPEGNIVIVFLTNRVQMDRRVRKKIVNAVLACLE